MIALLATLDRLRRYTKRHESGCLATESAAKRAKRAQRIAGDLYQVLVEIQDDLAEARSQSDPGEARSLAILCALVQRQLVGDDAMPGPKPKAPVSVVDPGPKACATCGEERPSSEFYTRSNGSQRNTCRACMVRRAVESRRQAREARRTAKQTEGAG